MVAGEAQAETLRLNIPQDSMGELVKSIITLHKDVYGLLGSPCALNQAGARYTDVRGENTGANHHAALDNSEGEVKHEAWS